MGRGRGYGRPFPKGYDPRRTAPFRKGGDPRKSTGAYPGHTPTNDGKNLAEYGRRDSPYNFASPLGAKNRHVGPHFKSKERRCLEEIQNGAEESDLAGRYPPRMVTRLLAVMKVAEDPDHDAWRAAFHEVRDILGARKAAEAEGPSSASGVNVTVNNAPLSPVPLPGAPAPGAEESEPPQLS